MNDFDTVKNLALWIVECIGKNQKQVFDCEGEVDWDWIAAEVWRAYPGIFNEFIINEAIEFIWEAAEN